VPLARDPVRAEVLARHFQIYPRSLLIASLFAIMAVLILRNVLPLLFLGAWLGFFLAVNAARVVVSRDFAAAPPEERVDPRWGWYATLGHVAGGAAWGALGAATVMFRPDVPQYLLVTLFVVAFFGVFQAANPSRYPPAYYGWMGAAMVPPSVAALLQGGEVYVAAAALSGLLFMAIILVSRSTHRLMLERDAQEVERVRLLESLTAQKDALDEANRAKTHFLAAASHDLRQPMQAISLLVESLQERAREPETRAIVASIRSSVTTMAALLNAILDISKFDAGTVRPEREHFVVGPVLERLRHAYAQTAANKGLELHIVPCSAVLETDPILLYRILSNLTDNALRYTATGRVLVGCRRRASGLSIEVWDTGPGIPEAQRHEIFREFVQLGNPQRAREQGLGLGLAIVERTAALLGHTLDVRSWPGRGSAFSLDVGYGDAARVREVAKADVAPLDGCSVLVVEDDASVRSAMKLLLEGWGCQVQAAESGEQARAQLARLGCAPDVVIADVRLPGDEDGIAVLDFIRARYPGTGGVLVSGDIAPEVLRRAQDSGYTLLHKPVRPARLRALMGHFRRARAAEPQAAPEAA
jgi:signal transduction histidine kinase